MVAEHVTAREVIDFQMTGRQRRDLFISYISALEYHEIKMPRLEPFYREHKYCSVDDLFGNGHRPTLSSPARWPITHFALAAPRVTTASRADGRRRETTRGGIVKLRLTAVSGAQHGGFTTGSSPGSCARSRRRRGPGCPARRRPARYSRPRAFAVAVETEEKQRGSRIGRGTDQILSLGPL